MSNALSKSKYGWKNVCKLWLQERTPEELKGAKGDSEGCRPDTIGFFKSVSEALYAVSPYDLRLALHDSR